MNLSVRARLTLGNVAIVALLLVALGASVRTIVRASLMTGIDRELTERGNDIRGETARRIRYEKGEFVFVGRRGRRDGDKPRTFPLDISAATQKDAPTAPLDNDTYAPRILNREGEPPLPFNRAPAWDRASVVAARKSHAVVLSTVTMDDEPFRVVTVPVRVHTDRKSFPPNVEPAFVQLAFRLTDIERGLSALDNALLTLLPLSLLVSGLGGAWLTGRALRPVRAITLATDRIAAESLGGRLPVTGSDEFGELSRRFNQMLERLETAFAKQQRFVADASHELRTPLAIVTAHTSLALDDEAPATPVQSRAALTAIHGAAGRMNRIVGDLLLLAQGDGGTLPRDHKPVVIGDVLQGAVSDAQTAYRERIGNTGAPITLSGTATNVVIADADVHQLRRVFVNLLENALRYTPADAGQITARLEASDNFVTVSIADTGGGIAPEHLPRLFDRFYRADAGRDRERGGTGLGLAIVQTLVHAHGGSVTVDSELGRGTVVSVTLPV